jgi:hypothetical protein
MLRTGRRYPLGRGFPDPVEGRLKRAEKKPGIANVSDEGFST